MKHLCLTILAAVLALQVSAQDDGLSFGKQTTQTRLILSADSAKPGETILAGVELKMAPGWHTYWRNGGDLGAAVATTIKWTLPPGVTAGAINWPVPEKLVASAGAEKIYSYVYDDVAVLLVPITLAADLHPGRVSLSADLGWLECKESCIPSKGTVSAELTIGGEDKPSTNAALLEHWLTRLPQTNAAVEATAQWENGEADHSRTIIIDWKTASKSADFYPYEGQGEGVQGATDVLPGEPGHLRLRKMIKKGDGPWPDQFLGILVTTNSPQNPQAVEIALPIQKATVAPVAAPAVLLEMLVAFVAGLILNIMPCVLPVIALKVLGFVGQSAEAPGRVRRLGLVYGLGVLVSFLALAALAIGAQRAGATAGWGDAIRHPQFRTILTVLMTMIALNLFGLFEITLGSGVASSAAGLASKQGYSGAFFNGILATLLATPCTAPYLAGALGFALAQPPAVTALVFASIGAGLAMPFVTICWNPGLLRALPKPGAWTEKFKIAMGFPMLATALWLAYASTRNQADMLRLEFFLATIALAAWVWGQFVQRGTRRKGLASVLCLLLVAAGFFVILPKASGAGIDWKTWSPEAVEAARKDGHPVLVDFTAKTCLTCIANKASSLEIDQTRAKLREIGAVAFVADFTDEDPVIARELKRWQGTAAVPLVLVYSKDPSQEPQVLPTVLTPGIVQKALEQAAK